MTIIAGPIVRHTNRNVVTVWMVVDQPYQSLELRVYSNKQQNKISRTTNNQHVKLGAACYVVLASANIEMPTRASLVYYDIVIDGQGFESTKLNKHICFPGESLPSVKIPKKHQHLLQASCRKPHDLEGIDQLGYAANLIGSRLRNADRPSQLFLTGDQIYADDVSPILLHSFREVRHTLGLEKEFAAKNTSKDFDPDAVYLDKRHDYLQDKHGFTSGEMDSHLITFAEYVCMYLFSFSGLLPGQVFARHDSLKPYLSYSTGGDPDDKEKICHYDTVNYAKDRRALDKFANNAKRKIRKVLANISVYMIFDDHEVTDDWNLSKENHTALTTSPIGRQVQVNALSAYYLCQHWGNQPTEENSQETLSRIEKLALSPTKDNRKSLESLWQRYWGYILEQKPPVVVFDTRTQRAFYEDDNQLALMSPEILLTVGDQLKLLESTPTLVVVSPTPMYGFTEAEVIQLRASSKKLKKFVDREPWVASELALNMLQAILQQTPGIKDTVIFSGDVHYAFHRRQVLNSGVTMWQLCSSAACNSPVGGNKGLRLLKTTVNAFQKKRTPYLVPQGTKKRILTSDKNIGSLILDDQLRPKEATLYCCSKSGRHYERVYDLMHPKEYIGKL